MFSFQETAPGSLASPNPVCVPDCQAQNTAPAGSDAMIIRPRSATSIGSCITWPPAALILAAVCSTSSVATVVVQTCGWLGSCTGAAPATRLPSLVKIAYPPNCGSGLIPASQPNREP